MKKLTTTHKKDIDYYVALLKDIATECDWSYSIDHSILYPILYLNLTLQKSLPKIREVEYRLVVCLRGDGQDGLVLSFEHRQKNRNWQIDNRPWRVIQSDKIKMVNACVVCHTEDASATIAYITNQLSKFCEMGMLQPIPD